MSSYKEEEKLMNYEMYNSFFFVSLPDKNSKQSRSCVHKASCLRLLCENWTQTNIWRRLMEMLTQPLNSNFFLLLFFLFHSGNTRKLKKHTHKTQTNKQKSIFQYILWRGHQKPITEDNRKFQSHYKLQNEQKLI